MGWETVLYVPALTIGWFVLFELPDVLKRHSDNKVRIQQLKTEEARELRLKAEAEKHHELRKQL